MNAGYIVGIAGFIIGAIGIAFAYRLYRWESHLWRTRITIAYKGKVKINSPMIDWLKWAQSLERDTQVRGHSVYKMGGTTVAILKKLPKDHGKTETTTVKQSPKEAQEAAA